MHHLTVQGYHLKPVAVGLRHGNGSVDIFRDRDPSQQTGQDRIVFFVSPDQVHGHSDKASALFQTGFLEKAGLDRGNRQEGGAAELIAFQILDRTLSVALAVNDYVLQRRAESTFNRRGIAAFHGNNMGNRPVYAAKLCVLGGLYDRLDGKAKPLHIFLKILQDLRATPFFSFIQRQRIQLRLQGLALFLSRVEKQLTSFEAVGTFLHGLLGRMQIGKQRFLFLLRFFDAFLFFGRGFFNQQRTGPNLLHGRIGRHPGHALVGALHG